MTAVIVGLISVLIGIAIGIVLFKLKQRWCHLCGRTLVCPECVLSKSTRRI
jgi:Flp pilus assembly pilin Flp